VSGSYRRRALRQPSLETPNGTVVLALTAFLDLAYPLRSATVTVAVYSDA
jgi:hypothetical protein